MMNGKKIKVEIVLNIKDDPIEPKAFVRELGKYIEQAYYVESVELVDKPKAAR